MKRRPTAFSTANPFLAWAELAIKTNEMLFASALVIHHRSNRILAAAGKPGPRDRREFTRMGQEKLEAAAESAQAIAARAGVESMALGMGFLRQMSSAAMWMPMFWSPQGQARLYRGMLSAYGGLASQAGQAAVRLSGHGLRPIHSRATANARRLVYRPLLRGRAPS